MPKNYVAQISDAEQSALVLVVKKMSGTSQKVNRAQMLLTSDADGPVWT